MIIIFLRAIIVFLVLFIVIRMMGKRQIGEMQPYELVITLLIAELAAIPLADVSIPMSYGIIAIVVLFILHQFLMFLENKSVVLNRLIGSKPSLIITGDGINFKELKKINISINEVQESMRIEGISNFDEIAYGLVETNGKFSFLKKKESSEIASSEDKTPLAVCIIENGKFKAWEMKRLNLDYETVKTELAKLGVKNVKDLEVATYDNNGKLYFQEKNKKYKVQKIAFAGATEW